ncbi:MAG: di-trans,poly-cis-decaprenylcistransferase [Treponema sp.]|nr:di-trans,poly-cis-decaprenylcistransferase [Treponema sp.]
MAKTESKMPVHVAVTMDGNGRWATKQNLPRTKGHQEGLKTAKRIVKAASDAGVKYLTLYTFSTENWKRAQEEVGFLMNLIHVHLIGELQFYKDNGIRICHTGDISALPKNIQDDLNDAMDKTKDYTGLTLNLAINYGGRDEIVRGIRKIAEKGIKPEDITENLVRQNLDMEGCPDVDLLIRTGGEFRLSNFLLWHVAYAEMVFTDTLWPDYTEEEFLNNLKSFGNRNRRFGKEK